MKHVVFVLFCLFTMKEQAMALTLTSPAFQPNQSIPSHHTCEGDNVSPPLEWSRVPEGTISFVLLVDDPDVPKNLRADGMWDHWVLYNIPTSVVGLSEDAKDFSGGIQGINTGGKIGYTGPCPPDREHRYFFKLYALDTKLSLPDRATKAQVEAAMKGHILKDGQAELVGLYVKKGKK